MNAIAPDMRARFDELVESHASLDDWSEFATVVEGAVRERQVVVLAMKRGSESDATSVPSNLAADFRALDALRRDVVAMIESLRSRITRDLQPRNRDDIQ